VKTQFALFHYLAEIYDDLPNSFLVNCDHVQKPIDLSTCPFFGL